MKNIYVIGSGGHSKVVIDILLQRKKMGEKIKICGILDDNYSDRNKMKIHEIPVIGRVSKVVELLNNNSNYFIIAIGNNKIREKISLQYKLSYYTAMHPTAIIGKNVNIQTGTVIMANAVINSYSEIGKHCIINTMSLVEHDCIINDYAHISPSTSLAGGVVIGKSSWIGIGSSVIQGIEVGKDTIIGAGSVVVKNIGSNVKAYGNPCREIII